MIVSGMQLRIDSTALAELQHFLLLSLGSAAVVGWSIRSALSMSWHMRADLYQYSPGCPWIQGDSGHIGGQRPIVIQI